MRTDVELGRLRVRRVTEAELDACLWIRRVVFIDEQAVPEDEELDGLDAESTHFLAEWQADPSGYVDEGWIPVGTARLRPLPDGITGKVERVCVLKEHRGTGVGLAIMHEVEAEARRHGRTRLKLASQEDAVPFYERQGYRAFGERFMDANIPHFWMDKELPGCEG